VPPASRPAHLLGTLDIYAPLAGRMGMQEMREENLEDLSIRTLDPEGPIRCSSIGSILAERNLNLIGVIEIQLSRKNFVERL